MFTPQQTIMHIISGDLWAGAEMQAYTLISSIRTHFNIVVVIMNDGELAQRLNALGIEVHIINEGSNSSPYIIYKLIKIISNSKPHLIHTHRIKENILGSIANVIAHFPHRRAACVRTVHGAPEFSGGRLASLRRRLDAFIANYYQDTIIAVSSALSEQLKHQHPRANIKVVHNGVDPSALQSLPVANDISSSQGIHIGIIGRLEPVKRIDIFIEMAELLRKESPTTPYRFHIVGDGSMREQVAQHINKLDLSEAVVLHGHRTDSQSLIAAMDLVVMCSDHEGTPMTALETLALEKPLVAHAVGGLKEILSAQPRFLVASHTPEGYAQKVKEILSTKTRAFLPEPYLQSNNTTQTIEIYKTFIV